MKLSIAYVTARKEPRFDWFFYSLSKQLEEADLGDGLRIVIVDFYASKRSKTCLVKIPLSFKCLRWVEPKPTVWQGSHRLTSVDYFAAANARNTALCLAPDGWIAYVDDASVLSPGWLSAVQEAMKREHTITLGAYRKVFDLKVENGLVDSFREDPLGMDIRNRRGKTEPVSCRGEWHYGSSLVAPVEAYLSINGWDENCDGMGYEDVVTGQLLDNVGWKFIYDPAMMTYESQELHRESLPMIRQDKGVSPKDKSHAILHSTRMRKWAPNYFGEAGIRGLRQRILQGDPFPIVAIPDCDWFDGQPLKEM